MVLLEILIVILAAIIIGSLFYHVFKYSGPWGSFWTFILILILAGLASAAWVRPIGPTYWDVAWIPVLFVIILFALLLAAASPPSPRNKEVLEEEQIPTSPRADAAVVTVSFLFWIFVVFLFVAAIWGIAWY
jgi:hypothetical protein